MTAAVVALLLVAGLLAAIWLLQRRMIYFPFGTPPPAAEVLPTARDVQFTTEDGLDLAAWFVPAAGAERGRVIVFHGNAGHRGHRAEIAAGLSARGFAVLLTDYRGFGGNPGSPGEGGLLRDARAARAWALEYPGGDPSRLIYFGESLGSGVAMALAVEQPPAAIVLRSPFDSLVDVAAHHYPILPVRWLLRDRYDSVSRAQQVDAPLLVVVGDHDRIVPPAASRRLFEASVAPVKRWYVVAGAGHNDQAAAAGVEMLATVSSFLEEVLAGSR